MNNQTGFTLIELLTAITVAVLMLAIGIPSFQDFLDNVRQDTATSDLTAALNMARSEAVRRGEAVSLRNTGGGGTWEEGWTMFVDTDRDGALDAGEVTLKVAGAANPAITIRSSADFTSFLTYFPSGRSNAADDLAIFAICLDNALAGSNAILVNPVGRIRAGRDADGDQIPETNAAANLASCTNP